MWRRLRGDSGGKKSGARSSDVWPTASIGASRQRTGTYDAKEKQRVPPGKHPEITRNPASQGTPKLAGPLTVAGEWHDLVDGGPLKPAALCASGGEQRLQLARVYRVHWSGSADFPARPGNSLWSPGLGS